MAISLGLGLRPTELVLIDPPDSKATRSSLCGMPTGPS
jgi:hypothetical protein